jgi:hypothetical protein
MEQPTNAVATGAPSLDFLEHLRDVFGWSREQSMGALGEWIMSSEAGRALLQGEESSECNETTKAA